jgi:hypothetical protein
MRGTPEKSGTSGSWGGTRKRRGEIFTRPRCRRAQRRQESTRGRRGSLLSLEFDCVTDWGYSRAPPTISSRARATFPCLTNAGKE